MNPWLQDLLYVSAGFLLLAKGAGWLVDGGASLARRWGVRPLVIGLTVVAWGTSVPELVVSGFAAWEGHPASSLGNVLGSNVANVALVLGSCALVLPSIVLGRIRPRELIWLLGSLGVLWGVCADREVTRMEALALLAAFVFYNFVLFRSPREAEATHEAEVHGARYPWPAVIVGSLFIAAGAQLVMLGAMSFAARIHMQDSVLGLTILALGTSLPELFAGVRSALKGDAEIGFGNVIGSNVFNSLAVMGCAGMIRAFGGSEAERAELATALSRDFPVCLTFSLALVSLPLLFRKTAGRLPGVLLLVAYFAYLVYVIYVGSGPL